MLFKIISFLIALTLFSFSSFSQNTNQNKNEAPDTNKTINTLSIPATGGGSTSSPALSPGVTKGLELEEQSKEFESPSKSEPVPGAEILIEQDSNDVLQNSSGVKPDNKEDKDKQKKKDKDKKPQK